MRCVTPMVPGLLAAVAWAGCTSATPSPRSSMPTAEAVVSTPAADRVPAPAEGGGSNSKPASPLRVVATREGDIELLPGKGIVLLEGEPVPLVDGVPVRHPSGGTGLPAEDAMDLDQAPTLAFIGDLDAPDVTWLTTARHQDRAYSDYTVYRRIASGWEQRIQRKGPLVAYFASYVERDGAVLGLRRWAPDPLDERYEIGEQTDEAQAYYARAMRALRRAAPAWVRLAGAEVQPPRVPSGQDPFTAVGPADGSIVALAHEAAEGDDPVVLLVWSPAARDAQRMDLPGATRDESRMQEPVLAVAGEWALVAGRLRGQEDGPGYLAVGRGTEWERVEPPRRSDGTTRIAAAARTPEGELWIAFGDRVEPYGKQPLWRKPPGGGWEPVPLPSLSAELFERGTGWAYMPDSLGLGTWSEVEREPLGTRIIPSDLSWGDGGIWITLVVGLAYDEQHLLHPFARSVLVTTRPGVAPLVRLPSAPQVHLERYNQRGATTKGCRDAALLLGPLPESPAPVVDAIAGVHVGEGEHGVEQIYVGRLDGAEQLVATVSGWGDDRAAAALASAIKEATGLTATLDCRIPTLVRMLKAE